tara:strand:+ start:24458 stop:25060 length:603 start_codon:yes stop_codon:yes gene_type:complete
MYKLFVKRVVDILVSFVLLVILSPVLILSAILIVVTSRGPVFFRQRRVGKDLKAFSILKFRTMTHEKREVGDKPLIGKAAGVTPIGYFLRRLKIDELPQLIHVFSGQMSLVGPRPSIPSQLEAMNEKQKRRYLIRPGLTGLAQVSGNIHLSWPERYEFDLKYIHNISLPNDIRILVRTAFLIVKGEEYYLNKPLRIHANA